jgi:hypothetical protein
VDRLGGKEVRLEFFEGQVSQAGFLSQINLILFMYWERMLHSGILP